MRRSAKNRPAKERPANKRFDGASGLNTFSPLKRQKVEWAPVGLAVQAAALRAFPELCHIHDRAQFD